MRKRLVPGTLLLGIAIGTATLAVAHHRAVLVNGVRVSEDTTQKCECRARGQAYTTGEQICLNGRVATCEMDQNVTTWRLSNKLCPEARLSLRQ
ncbi:MAG: hypothetical protein ACRCWF_08585 [Beijerinckiaceae bacterium]